jgi:hypothetical protein
MRSGVNDDSRPAALNGLEGEDVMYAVGWA